MPLFYQHTINHSTRLAVWHITEDENFFSSKVNIKKEITHPHKRLQHFAGRYLLQLIEPAFPMHLISISGSKKPLLSNEEFHFSISHCGDYAAAILSQNNKVGIDVELVTPKIEVIKTKFLTEYELDLADSFSAINSKIVTLFWSSKEAIYKWYGQGALSFKRNMGMNHVFLENEKGFIDAHFIKDERINLKIEFQFFDTLCLAWVIG